MQGELRRDETNRVYDFDQYLQAQWDSHGRWLATLGAQFGQNVLADERAYLLALETPDDRAGLPGSLLAAAAETAAERGLPGQHGITLSRSSIEPFLQFSDRRDLREKIFQAFTSRGDNAGKTDNKAIIAEMVRLRAEYARLLGFDDFAHYRLDDAMAKTPRAVRDLLDTVWPRARARALADRDALQAIAQQEGGNFKLAAWDWRYYAEKLRKRQCDIDEAAIKPYLNLDRMIEAGLVAKGNIQDPRRIYYRLTAFGEATLRAETERLSRVAHVARRQLGSA